MPDLTCSGPGPHEPEDGVLGTTDAPGASALCPLCAEPVAPDPRPLEAEIVPAGSPRDLTAVRERTV